MMPNNTLLHGIYNKIVQVAERHGLAPDIVFAVCTVESGLDPWAARHETHYKWLFNPHEVKPRGCSLDTEITFQKTSWGLMQVMGGVLRESGYRGWLNAIGSDIEQQLHYGCRHLAKKIARYGLEQGILAYNSGTPIKNAFVGYVNATYLNKVLEARKHFSVK